jgi:hypothetical protein
MPTQPTPEQQQFLQRVRNALDFGFHCCVCGQMIPEKRAHKSSPFCSDWCRKVARKVRAIWRDEIECMLCGRPKGALGRRKKAEKVTVPGTTTPQGKDRAA